MVPPAQRLDDRTGVFRVRHPFFAFTVTAPST